LLELIKRDLDLEEELEKIEDTFKQDEIVKLWKLWNVEGKTPVFVIFMFFESFLKKSKTKISSWK